MIIVLYSFSGLMTSPNSLYFDDFVFIFLDFTKEVIADLRIHLNGLSMCPILESMRVLPARARLIITTRVSHNSSVNLAVFLIIIYYKR